MTELIDLLDITKTYTRGKRKIGVLSQLCLHLEMGKFLAIMGPSGSGKSTLLNLIGGIDRPDSGEIIIGDYCITKLSQRKLTSWRSRHIGFVFQNYSLIPVLTAEQNVEIPLFLTRLTRQQRTRSVQTALEVVGFGDRHKHRPAELSGGQQQRVAIARALVADPSLLVCDEPTGDLDLDSTQEILAVLRSLCDGLGKTIIMATHDERAAAYADRTIHLDKGVLRG